MFKPKPVIIVVIIFVFLLGAYFIFTSQDDRATLPYQNETKNATPEKIERVPAEKNPSRRSTKVSWDYDGENWYSIGNPPPCPEQIIKQTPTDITLATSINYPGVAENGDYTPHGGFGFENSKPDDITVYVPQDGFVIGGVRYIQEGELQYLFDFSHPCGIMYRLDHLLELSPKFQEIAEKLPEPKVDDSRGTTFNEPVKVESGEVIATAVGFRNFPGALLGFDFGVYDIRQKNQAAQDPTWLQKHGGDQAPYALCWLDLLPPKDKPIAKNLPCPGGGFECKEKSDYCL